MDRLSVLTGTITIATAGLLLGCSAQIPPDGNVDAKPAASASSAERSDVKKMIGEWPNRPKLGAQQMIAKYGEPQEATGERLVWHNQGPYKRILVTRQETPHDFPKPHMDYLEHTIAYRVPADKAGALTAYDGSATFDRTAGELSAKCDLEGHNILTLNLAHDVVTGKKDAETARKAFGEAVVQDAMGMNPADVTTLRVEPSTSAADAGVPVIPGSPRRAPASGAVGTSGTADTGDSEVLGFVGAVNENEILAAAEAAKKNIRPEVKDYAMMLHKAHGKNLGASLQLGQKIGVTPMETSDVDKFRVKGAGELAALIPLNGNDFEGAYLDAMIQGHTEVLKMIDDQLLPGARNAALQAHLKTTRNDVAQHLEQAKQLKGDGKR
jgi:predicted outer membrane protein